MKKFPILSKIKSLNDSLANLNYLQSTIKRATMVNSFAVPLPRSSWVCGLLICNTNGGGNGIYYIESTGSSFTGTKIASNQGNNQVISGTYSNGVLTLTATLNSNTLRFDYAVWIGLG